MCISFIKYLLFFHHCLKRMQVVLSKVCIEQTGTEWYFNQLFVPSDLELEYTNTLSPIEYEIIRKIIYATT